MNVATPRPDRTRAIVLRIVLAIAMCFVVRGCLAAIPDVADMIAMARDPSCSASIPRATNARSRDGGACTVVDAKVAESGVRTIATKTGTEDQSYVILELADGTLHKLDVNDDLYSASLTSEAPVRAQLFDGRAVRIAIGDASSSTSDSPLGRMKRHAIWLVFGFLFVYFAIIFAFKRAAKATAEST